jgi:flagellar basal-body rod protein FlgB
LLERIFDSKTQFILNESMDAASLRNNVIADNIANVDTPKFKRSEVIFEENLKKVLEKNTIYAKLRVTHPRHIQIGEGRSLDNFEPEVRLLDDLSFRNDENNVDIDVEMAKMSKNKIHYDSLGQSMNNEFQLLRLAITGRR